MENSNNQSDLDALVGRIFVIDDITAGNPEKDYIVRYRGHLRSEDSESAYDQLAAQLRPMNITPLFRIEDGRQAILLVPGRPQPKPSNPWVNLGMFILTLLSVLFVGCINALGTQTEPLPSNPLAAAGTLLRLGLPFALALLTILGCHEFGHYLMGRHHGVHLTLPYFIPFPLPPFGTMGAVINMKEPPKNRNHLLDIGLAGPFAGLIIGIPILVLGLSLSNLEPDPNRDAPGEHDPDGRELAVIPVSQVFDVWTASACAGQLCRIPRMAVLGALLFHRPPGPTGRDGCDP